MKKLSKIEESVWSDIQDRSTGEVKRREDDINLLDLEGLRDYLNKIYKSSSSVSKSICVQHFKPNTELCVSLYEDIDGYYRFLFYNGSVVNTQRDVLYELKCNKEIQQKYSFKQLKNDFGVETVDIYPKDGSPVNNEFFLEVLEFFLENIKEPYTKLIEKIEDVKESVWSDIQDRSTGETVRKEDSIDLLDEEGLLAYLQKHYKINNCPLDIRLVHDNSDIEIPFCTAGYKNIKINALYYDCSSHTVFLRNDFYKYLPELHNKLKKEFQMTDNPNWPFYINLSPKDNTEITNTFFIKVLEFVIDNMDNTVTPTITRRQVNESVWSDIQDRSTGKTIRKEDEINVNLLDKDEFFKYIKSNYEVFGQTLYKIEYTDKRFIVIPILKHPYTQIIEKIYIDLSFGIIDCYFWLPKPLEKLLKNKYKIRKLQNTHWMIEQEEKDWDRMNEFYINVIDTLITFDPSVLRKKGINESVWSDIQDRSSGEVIRKEDEIGNIKKMIPVDMGGSVLWSDRDLEIDDNCYFSFDEANELIKDSGWRLPTREEAEELCIPSVRIERNTDKICIVYRDDSPDVKMVFNKCGQKYGDNDDRIYRKDTYNAWTSTTSNNYTETYKIFKISSLIFGTDIQMHKNNKICVRLVKDKPKDIKESVWSDIQDRSTGELEREEDDIDRLDIDTFLDYLKDRYQRINQYSPRITKNEKLQSISVPIYFVPTNFFTTYLVLGFKDNKDITFNVETSKFPFVVDRLFDNLKEQFNITTGNKRKELNRDVYTEDWTISPKDGKKVTNQFMVEVIDFLLDNIDEKPFIKQLVKNVNESIWSDIQDRSTGEMTKKEDDINFMDIESFKEYIEHFDDAITKVYLGHDKDFISVDEIYIEAEKKDKHYQLLLVIEYPEKNIFMNANFKRYAPDVFSKLTKEFSVSVKSGFIYINPKDGSEKTNRFFLDVLRFILDNLKNSLNESVWSDIQDRSTGEKERKEDEINFMDINHLFDYITAHYITKPHIINDELYIPVLLPQGGKFEFGITVHFLDNGEKYVTTDVSVPYDLEKDIYDKLQDNFHIEPSQRQLGKKKTSYFYTVISPKDGSETNLEFVIELLDFLVDNIKNKKRMILKRK